MNTGVSTTPRRSVRRPRRARPSVARTWNVSINGLSRRRRGRPARARSSRRQPGLAREQHRVAVAEEAVALGDGVSVERANALVAGERGDEHEQRALGQVEVREQQIDDAKGKARSDEEVRLPL